MATSRRVAASDDSLVGALHVLHTIGRGGGFLPVRITALRGFFTGAPASIQQTS